MDLWIASDNTLTVTDVTDDAGTGRDDATVSGVLTNAADGTTPAGVTNPVTFTLVSAGSYDYAASLGTGVTLLRGRLYRLLATISAGGATRVHEFIAPAHYYAPQGEGRYAKLSKARERGQFNASQDTSTERTLAEGEYNLHAVAGLVRRIDNKVDRLAGGQYGWTTTPIADDHANYEEISDLASDILFVELALLWPAQSGEAADVARAERDRLWAELATVLITGADADDSERDVMAPIALRPTVDAEGRTVTDPADFPGPYFDPFYRGWRN
jgi:hypothetical protein